MPARSTRRGQRRGNHRGMGKKPPPRLVGSAAPRGRTCRQREQCGHSPGSGNWCHAWTSGKPSLGWSERCGPSSALPTQKIAYSTLSVKLWRPPFMDLEIGLRVSACACQAQIFPRGKRQVVPHIFPRGTLSIQWKRIHSWNPSLLWACLLCLPSIIYKYAKQAQKGVGIQLLNLPLW